MTGLVLEGKLSHTDRDKNPIVYLPFEVPPRTSRIDVQYSYDAENILDIGILDPNVAAFPSRSGFRGWSGSARSSFFVATDSATPGYIAGEIPADSWQIMLGLAKITLSGCSYRVEISLDSAMRGLIAPPGVQLPVPSEPGWYKGDLQSHTHHSDATGTLNDLVAAAKARGLDFLAVTEHNTISHHRYLAEVGSADLLLVPGEEITTYRGHANVWGVRGWTDFRIQEPAQLKLLVADVHDRGGLFSINHPKETPNCIGCDWEYPIPEGVDCFEAWQGPWFNQNWESLARYDDLLKQGRRITLVGGSDRHQPDWPDPDPDLLQVASPTTWLYLEELSVDGVLQGLRRGRAFVCEAPEGPQLEIFVNENTMGSSLEAAKPNVTVKGFVKGAAGDQLRWLGSSGVLRETSIRNDDFIDAWTCKVQGTFIRAEVVATANDPKTELLVRWLEHLGKSPGNLTTEQILSQPLIRAISNPVYFQSN